MSKLFRQKSLERISSPEQLNAYIRVSTPSVWLLLSAIVVLLIGVCVWGVFGRLDTTLSVLAVSQDGCVTAYVRQEDADRITGSKITINGTEAGVQSVVTEPVCVDDSFTEYMRYAGGLQEGEWLRALTLDADCPEGVYTAQIMVDSVSPLSFVLN